MDTIARRCELACKLDELRRTKQEQELDRWADDGGAAPPAEPSS